MIEILDIEDENIVGLRIDGNFDADDVKRVFDALEDKLIENERIRVYYEILNLDLSNVSREMLEIEFKYLIMHPSLLFDLEKIVLVTDIGWVGKVFAVETALIPTMTGKTFSLDEKDQAMGWLRMDHRAENQMDVVFSEFVEMGTLKAIGGFGLGLLVANSLGKDQRKSLGIAALAGSIIFGLPFAVKILNNNRNLLGKG